RRYFDLLQSRRADDAICLDPDTVQQALQGEAQRFPWVACCEFDSEAQVPYVGIDNRAAAREAVSYLIQKGHAQIAFVNSDSRFMYARERLQGYADALELAGIAMQQRYCVNAAGLGFAAGKAVVKKLLAMAERGAAWLARGGVARAARYCSNGLC